MNKKLWLGWFTLCLSIFGAWEYYAITDGNEDTYTLTTAVITYVPEWIFWLFLLPSVSWLIYHFYTYYKNYKKKK